MGARPSAHPLDPRLTTVVPAMPFLGIWPTILGFEGVCILGYWDLTKEFDIQIYFDKKNKEICLLNVSKCFQSVSQIKSTFRFKYSTNFLRQNQTFCTYLEYSTNF